MSKIDLELDFDSIRERINQVKKGVKPSVWADMLGVSRNIVANVHGQVQQKPSLEYIVAVSKATGKSVDYYLWGKVSTDSNQKETDLSNLTPVNIKHQGLVSRFKDPERGLKINGRLIDIEKTSDKLYDKVDTYIQGVHEAALIMNDDSGQSKKQQSVENDEKKNAG